MIRSWLFEFFHQPLDAEVRSDPQAVQDHFRWYIDLWTRADGRNFEGIFFSEHHFGAAYSPSPNLLLSHVAAPTNRLRLGVLDAALKNNVVTHHGEQWKFDDLEILPRCLQQPSPPVWTAVRSAGSAERAGRRGWKACGGFLSAKEVAVVFDSYRLGAEEAGHEHGPEQVAVRRMVTFVDTPSAAPRNRSPIN